MSRGLCANLAILCVQSFFIVDAGAQSNVAIGITRKGTEIPAYLSRPGNLRIVIIGGHDGAESLVRDAGEFALALDRKLGEKPVGENGKFPTIAVIPNVYPDGLPEELDAESAVRGYPPKDGFYDHKSRPEQRYLWRWLAMFGPDVIIDLRTGPSAFALVNQRDRDELAFEKPTGFEDLPLNADDFARQAGEKGLALGRVPTAVFQLPAATTSERLVEAVTPIISEIALQRESLPHFQLQWLKTRATPLVVRELSTVYGKDLKQVAYIPALAVIGRLQSDEAKHDRQEAESLRLLVEPFRSGMRNPVPTNGSEQAGHLLFAELAKRSKGKDRERWIELCKVAADQVFDKEGRPLKLMPYHNEMSDAVFMATPILCATGKLTGDKKYFDAAVTHFRGMKKLCLREDGIYRHSPLDEAAWGRGNGFPAMGLAWALSEFPEDHTDFPELKKDFQNHITALLKHQDVFGCWHQVIDKPGSYREFSATCMIAWAMKRGLDRGWLSKEQCEQPLARAWTAAKQRIGPKGVVVDICTGTGKQKSLRDYYDRPAIWGVDARGGAMALMLATEMMESK